MLSLVKTSGLKVVDVRGVVTVSDLFAGRLYFGVQEIELEDGTVLNVGCEGGSAVILRWRDGSCGVTESFKDAL